MDSSFHTLKDSNKETKKHSASLSVAIVFNDSGDLWCLAGLYDRDIYMLYFKSS